MPDLPSVSAGNPGLSAPMDYQQVLSVLAAHRIALWEYDIASGRCHFGEDYFRILELDKAGIFFADLEDFYRFACPEDEAAYREAFAKMLASDSKTAAIPVRCVGRHGGIIYLEDHFFSYRAGAGGCPEKLIAYTANVTLRYEGESRIRRLEDRNRRVIEALPEFIFIFDDNFFITDVLMAENTVLLHPREALVGADGRDIYAPEVSDLFLRNIRQCLEDGQLKQIEYYLDMDGVRHYFQARIAPFEEKRALALIHDIGERVRRDKELIEAKRRAEEAARMKSVFLATMSHEIRTPLNAIVGFSEVLSTCDNPADRAEYMGIIRQNSTLLLKLIDDILDISRIEAGKADIRPEPLEAVNLLEEVGKVNRLKMPQGVQFALELPEGNPTLLTDRNRVTQILFNFLSNAAKHTRRGTVALGARPREGGWLEFYVRDTGSGIPPDKLKVIFNRFEKLDDFVQGTGLGLAICQSLSERLGGRIEVQSAVGEGSTFSLWLPYDPQEGPRAGGAASMVGAAEAAAASPGESAGSAGSATLGGPAGAAGDAGPGKAASRRRMILVAEDVEANFRLLQALLRKDYTLLWAANGEEAVNLYVRERPDLVLMDIKMPVMNGIEATEKIRTVSAEVPIIAVTAHAFYTEQRQAINAGCNAIVSKPYSLTDLKETIEMYIH